ITSTGGQAKLLILDGEVKVNGIVETRRGRKLGDDDLVTIGRQTFKVGEIISSLDN
ncbi:MAG: RNA-binding S4 domain-containing protein, partial [Dolichospermum sp.]